MTQPIEEKVELLPIKLPCANCGHAKDYHDLDEPHGAGCVFRFEDDNELCHCSSYCPAPAEPDADVLSRAIVFYNDVEHWKYPSGDEKPMTVLMADFATAETATLSTKLEATRVALGDLNQMAADVRDVFCPQTNNEAKALINLTSALAKAEAILSADDKAGA